MMLQAVDVEDVTEIASLVRSLASDARDLLRSQEHDRESIDDVLRRIDEIRVEYGERPSSQIGRWLESLRRQVERL